MNLPSALFFSSLLASSVLAESEFSQPPAAGPAGNYQDNPSYSVGEKIDVQWTSNLTTMNLLIWQDYPMASETDAYYDTLLNYSRSTSMIYEVTLDGYATNTRNGDDAVFYFALYESGTNNVDATCHYFNVSLPDTSSSTTTATATVSTHIGHIATTSAAADTTTTAAEPTESSDSSSLSTGAVAGISVGATLGGLAALGVIGFFAWKRFRKSDPSGNYTPGTQAPPVEENKPPIVGQSGWVPPPYGQSQYGQSQYEQSQYEQSQYGHTPVQQNTQIYEAPANQPKTPGPVYEAP